MHERGAACVLSCQSKLLPWRWPAWFLSRSGPTGLGAQQARKLCPPDIEVACYNGPKFCTLSGPVESMKKFVKALQKEGVFAEVVNCGNIAQHSKHISSVGPLLLKYLKQVKHLLCS
jgi:acyl transferase domain-containing protein